MHLALIISSLSPGGAERVMSALANHWARRGHKVSLITFSPPTEKPFYPLHPTIQLIQLNQTHAETSPFKRLKNSVIRIWSLRKAIKKLNPDRILSFVDLTNITTLLATWGLKIPVVVGERIDPNFYTIPRFYQWLRRRFYPLAQRVVVQTKNAATYFSNQKNISIIPNPVSQSDKTLEPSTTVKKIISIGRLAPQKDHSTLLQALPSLISHHPDLTLTIYGEGAERKNLEALIKSLKLEGKVFLPGAVQNIQEKLLESDLFIFPSRFEGFPNALCEALAIGLPTLASNCSGNVDVIEDSVNGRLFPVGDVQALTTIALELMDDLPQRQHLSKNAKTLPQTFSLDRIYQLWDGVMEIGSNKVISQHQVLLSSPLSL
jgi:GalNAc-alpha-(1->4)-GalNAc-alpha-(1->3)-diNAcBac-PP-undecaprenol alpha-1,4-N-acetyl-D-galactosaminyltransferase